MYIETLLFQIRKMYPNFVKKKYVLEEILGLNSASFPNDQGRFTCMHMNTSIQIIN